MLRVGEMIFPREEHTNWLFNTKCSTLRSCAQKVYGLSTLYLEIRGVCVCVSVGVTKSKRVHKP